jgi:drug/metabolite transporter (DMT)-like permease
MYLEYLIVFVVFGIRPVIYKYILPYIEVESVILISGWFYAMLSILYVLLVIPLQSKLIGDIGIMNKKKSIYGWLLCTSLMGLIATYFYLYLLKERSAFLLTALLSAYPLVTALAGYLVLKEVVTLKQVAGSVIIIVGAMILNIDNFDY